MKIVLFTTALLMSSAASALTGPAKAAPTATSDYPPCSRMVTDHCIQTNERGMRVDHGVGQAWHRHDRHHRHHR